MLEVVYLIYSSTWGAGGRREAYAVADFEIAQRLEGHGGNANIGRIRYSVVSSP